MCVNYLLVLILLFISLMFTAECFVQKIKKSPFADCKQYDETKMCMLQNECEFMEVRKLFNKLIKLEDIVKSQSFDHLIQIRFYVFGKDECHIFLLPNTTLNDNRGYHFIIGGWNNNRTVIRERNAHILRDTITPNVLSDLEPIEFQIEITRHGDIKLFRENDIIAEGFDQSPLGINYISFGTIDNSEMVFFYNCGTKDTTFDETEMVSVNTTTMAKIDSLLINGTTSETPDNETELVSVNTTVTAKVGWFSMSGSARTIPIALQFNVLIIILLVL